MDISTSIQSLVAAALSAFEAFLQFLLSFFGFFIVLINSILAALHIQ